MTIQVTTVADIIAALQKYPPNTTVVGDRGNIWSLQEAHPNGEFTNIALVSWDYKSDAEGPILGKIEPSKTLDEEGVECNTCGKCSDFFNDLNQCGHPMVYLNHTTNVHKTTAETKACYFFSRIKSK